MKNIFNVIVARVRKPKMTFTIKIKNLNKSLSQLRKELNYLMVEFTH